MADAQAIKPASETTMVVDADDTLREKYAYFDRQINRLSCRRVPSPLKDILQFIHLDGMISFARGE